MTNAFSRMYNQINEYQQRYKSKLYERLRFKIKMTEETRLKMSISRIGKIHSQETKNKIGAKHKNKIISQETREKTSKWMKENPATKETILKITLANTGKVRSEQSKQNYKNSWTKERRDERSKQVKARTNMNLIKYKAEHIDGRVFIIDNINDWCKENFVNISTLKGTLGGKFSRKY